MNLEDIASFDVEPGGAKDAHMKDHAAASGKTGIVPHCAEQPCLVIVRSLLVCMQCVA